MSTSTDGEPRVEVTPELLANLEEHLRERETKRHVPIDRLFALALVKRIRELETPKASTCWTPCDCPDCPWRHGP